jgi:hypothetical protein
MAAFRANHFLACPTDQILEFIPAFYAFKLIKRHGCILKYARASPGKLLYQKKL